MYYSSKKYTYKDLQKLPDDSSHNTTNINVFFINHKLRILENSYIITI